MLRLLSTAAVAANLILAPLSTANSPGIVQHKPATGRFVKIDRGYMVPYEVKIPETDDSFRMEPIPGGTFLMGSPPSESGRDDIEGPQVTWSVDPFWMAQCEVTQGHYHHYMALYSVFKDFKFQQYVKVTEKNRIDAVTAPTTLYEPDYIFSNGKDRDMPMIAMSLYAAKQYSKWLSRITGSQFRLPTEAEWEYACRAGTTTAYHFGNDPAKLSDYAWYAENSYDFGLRKVGTKKPNPWGLYDMHGNVAEWVHDHCTKYKVSDIVPSAARDWIRTKKVDPKSVRGGSWMADAKQCRSASRLPSDIEGEWNEEDPDYPPSPWWLTSEPTLGIGFRLVRPLKKMTPQEQKEFWEPSNETTQLNVEIRIEEARGSLGYVDKNLPKAIKEAANKKQTDR